MWEESSKEAHEGGERKISPPCDPPLCAPKAFSFEHPPPRRTPICLAPIEMFRSGNVGSVSDEARGKRFFALRPQNDKRRKRISQSVILSVSEESFHFAHIRIFCIRHPEAPQGAVAIRFFRISHLLQICGFAGLFIVLSSVLGTPLSSLVRRKLQRSTRRRGEENLPALRSTPLRAEVLFF